MDTRVPDSILVLTRQISFKAAAAKADADTAPSMWGRALPHRVSLTISIAA